MRPTGVIIELSTSKATTKRDFVYYDRQIKFQILTTLKKSKTKPIITCYPCQEHFSYIKALSVLRRRQFSQDEDNFLY